MFDFRVITFLEVCKTMNYTKAAKLLGLTQPAVSQHIHWLEEQYGIKFFAHQGKKVILTDAGNKMQAVFTTMQTDLQNIRRNIKDDKKIVRFGVTPTVGAYIIPKPLLRYKRAFKDVHIKMKVDNTFMLCQLLDKGEIDFAIVEGYFYKNNYDALLYKSERYVAVCSFDLEISSDIRRISDLVGLPIIIRENGSGNREIIKRSLSRYNLSIDDFKSVIEISDLHSLKSMVLEGAGIGFLYKSAVENELKSGEMREIILDDFDETHDITFIWRKNSIYSEEYKEIHKFFMS